MLLLLQGGILLVRLFQRHLGRLRHHLRQAVGFRQLQLQHTRHILDGHLGSHTAERHDVRHLVGTVLFRHPLQHLLPAGIIEVHIDIRQRYTVGIQKALEQQVVFHRVYIRNPQAISHRTTGSRATPGTHNHPHIAGCPDKILHNQEVSRETHRFHDMQLEHDAVHQFGRRILPVAPDHALHRQFLQIVRLQLDAVQAVDASQLLDFLLPLLLRHHHIPFFVAGELVEQVLRRVLLPVLLLRTDFRRNGKHRHQRVGIQLVLLHLVRHLLRILDGFGQVGKQLRHLLRRLEPLLAGVAHPVRVVDILARIQANQQIMRLRILGIQEMDVVRRQELDAQLFRHLDFLPDALLLPVVHIRPLLRLLRRVAHHLQIIILPEQVLVPQRRLLRPLQIACHNLLVDFPSETRGRDYQPLMVFLQQLLVDAGTVIIPLHKSSGGQFHQIPVARQVLGEQNQVLPRPVYLLLFIETGHTRHISLASQYRLDTLLPAGVVKQLDAEHIPMVRQRQCRHPVGNRLVD